MDFELSPRAEALRARVKAFVREQILPVEPRVFAERAAARRGGDFRSWTVAPEIEALKAKAKSEGLWNLFASLPSLDYAPLAEEMGWSVLAPEVFNCNAPDTGNMELLARYGTPEQKERWLEPLMDGRIRSAFCMTEPDVASSDATNVHATATLDEHAVVLNGRKWWATGLGHPKCEIGVFMGVTDPDADRHRRHSMVLVPLDAPGVVIERMLTVLNDYDEPYGHGEATFTNVRVPLANVLGGPGMGFALAQARLGPGRIHHCMRCIGGAERALELLVTRALSRTAFGKPLVDLGGNRERIAELRVAIDQARLLTLHAAWKLDALGPEGALADVSAIKLVAPSLLTRVADEAMQMFGGEGLSSDAPLAALFALGRTLRIADGPDSVHRAVIAKVEIGRHRRGR
jgi:alkylation response protein AidB-like acyl-CoA dehydrogenase